MDGLSRKRHRYRSDGRRTPKADTLSNTDLNKATEAANNTSGSSDPDSPTSQDKGAAESVENGDGRTRGKKIKNILQKDTSITQPLASMKHEPEEYYHAKKKLKKAVLECYR